METGWSTETRLSLSTPQTLPPVVRNGKYSYGALRERLSRTPMPTGVNRVHYFPFSILNSKTWTPLSPVFMGLLAIGLYMYCFVG